MVWVELGSMPLHGSFNFRIPTMTCKWETDRQQIAYAHFNCSNLSLYILQPFKMLFTLFAFGDEWCVAHRVLGVIDYIGTIFYVLEYAHKNGCVKGEMHLTCMDFLLSTW